MRTSTRHGPSWSGRDDLPGAQERRLCIFQKAGPDRSGEVAGGGVTTGNILERITPGAIPYGPVRGRRAETRRGVSIDIGRQWAFYRDFSKAYQLDCLYGLIKVPEVTVATRRHLRVQMLVENETDEPAEVTLPLTLPAGWKEVSGTARYPLRPPEAYPAQSLYVTRSTRELEQQTLTWKAEDKAQTIGALILHVTTN
jgi:hypothetical protein